MLDIRKVGSHLGRSRHESGWVVKTGKQVKKWRGFYHVYAKTGDGREKRLRRKVLLGTCEELTKGAAEDKLREHIRQSRGERVVIGPGTTVGDLCDRWFEMKKANWSEANQKTVRAVFESLIKPAIGSFEVGRIEAEDLKALVDGLPKRQWKTPKGGNRAGVSDSYARKTITYLRSVFDYAVEKDLITKNPARRQVVKLKTPLAARKPLKKVLAPEDGERILAQLDTGEDRLIIRVALVCALRPSEIFALKRNDVDLVDGSVRVDESLDRKRNLKAPKTESSKATIPVAPKLKEELAKWMKAHPGNLDDLLFPNRDGRPKNRQNELNRMLKPAALRAGLGNKVTFQMLRRTFATHAQGKGNLKDVQAQMRHSKPDVTAGVYMQAIPEQQRQTVQAVEDTLFGSAQRPTIRSHSRTKPSTSAGRNRTDLPSLTEGRTGRRRPRA
jgi:integrase